MIKTYFLFLGLLLSSFCPYAAEKIPRITVSEVAGNIYIIESSHDHNALVGSDWDNFSGGNIGLSIGKDGVLIVDTKYTKFADEVKAAIDSVGGDAPKFILDTHSHDDHMNANPVFSEQGTVIAHSKARTRIMEKQPKEAWPVITFDDKISIHLNGEEIKVLHYPNGHTDGDAVIFFTKSNVMHMGDLFFNGYLPFIDLDSGGDVKGYVNNIDSILASLPDDVRIIPGHGPVASKSDLGNYHRMLQDIIPLVTSQMHAGKSLETIKQMGLQKEWSKAWGMVSTDSFIETIYKSYSR
jgi:cyclase